MLSVKNGIRPSLGISVIAGDLYVADKSYWGPCGCLVSSQISADSILICYSFLSTETPVFLRSRVFILDVLYPLFHMYSSCVYQLDSYVYEYGLIQEWEKYEVSSIQYFTQKNVELYKSSGGWGRSLYKYITLQGHDPSTASHPGTLPVLFNGAKRRCRALDPGLCSAFPPCIAQVPQSLCYLYWL